MKFDDSDAVRHKVPLPVKRDISQVSPVGRVQAKYSAEGGEELPEFNPNLGREFSKRKHKGKDAETPNDSADVADISDVHGLDFDEAAPEIIDVVDNMMGEITKLRSELNIAQHRITYLESLSDIDPVAGCLSAPAFVRHVAQVLLLDQKSETVSCLAMGTIKGWEAIHHGMNRKADELVISHIGKMLLDGVRTGDSVGHTADDEFAILFVASDKTEAQSLLDEIQKLQKDAPLLWSRGAITIEMSWTLLSLAEFSEVDDVMAEADRAMRLALKG